MREGYLLGWFDFNYKFPWSHRREQMLMDCLEQKLCREYFQTKTVSMAAMLPALVSTSKMPFKAYDKANDDLLLYSLPWIHKTVKMKSKPDLTPAKLREYKQHLEAFKKQLEASRAKEQEVKH